MNIKVLLQRASRCVALFFGVAVFSVGATPQVTQQTSSSLLVAKSKSGLAWSELTQAEREALSPLESDWSVMGQQEKRKWKAIALRYPHMKLEDQQRAQQRMQEWTKLTPAQRRIARDSYARAQALSPEKRVELMQKYQELPEHKKKQLAAEKPAKALLVQKLAPKKSSAPEGKFSVPNDAIIAPPASNLTPATNAIRAPS